MSQILGAFGLLDFTMLRPVLAWRAFGKLLSVYFFNSPNFFRAAVNRGYGGPPVLNYCIVWRCSVLSVLLQYAEIVSFRMDH